MHVEGLKCLPGREDSGLQKDVRQEKILAEVNWLSDTDEFRAGGRLKAYKDIFGEEPDRIEMVHAGEDNLAYRSRKGAVIDRVLKLGQIIRDVRWNTEIRGGLEDVKGKRIVVGGTRSAECVLQRADEILQAGGVPLVDFSLTYDRDNDGQLGSFDRYMGWMNDVLQWPGRMIWEQTIPIDMGLLPEKVRKILLIHKYLKSHRRMFMPGRDFLTYGKEVIKDLISQRWQKDMMVSVATEAGKLAGTKPLLIIDQNMDEAAIEDEIAIYFEKLQELEGWDWDEVMFTLYPNRWEKEKEKIVGVRLSLRSWLFNSRLQEERAEEPEQYLIEMVANQMPRESIDEFDPSKSDHKRALGSGKELNEQLNKLKSGLWGHQEREVGSDKYKEWLLNRALVKILSFLNNQHKRKALHQLQDVLGTFDITLDMRFILGDSLAEDELVVFDYDVVDLYKQKVLRALRR